MNPAAPFIGRPVATTLLTIGIALVGLFAFLRLPVAPLPQVDYPTISVSASLPGASPDTMAATVATPLERHLGVIADVTEMTSRSAVGSTNITLQFSLNRSLDGAARDVQAAINAARADLPTSLPQSPSYHKVNPADAPIAILALTSETLTLGQIYNAASTVMQQALSQIGGVGEVEIVGSSLPAVRVELNPLSLFKYDAHAPKGMIEDGDRRLQIYTNDQANYAEDYRQLVIAYRYGAPLRLTEVAEVEDSVENVRTLGLANGTPSVLVILHRQPGANIIATVDRVKAALPKLEAAIPRAINAELTLDRTTTIRGSLRGRADPRHRGLPRNPGRLFIPAQSARGSDPERRGPGLADRHLRGDVSLGVCHRPCHGGAPGTDREPDRQYVVRRLWAAAGIGDLQGAEPVPHCDGGCARVLAIPGDTEPDLCQHRWRPG